MTGFTEIMGTVADIVIIAVAILIICFCWGMKKRLDAAENREQKEQKPKKQYESPFIEFTPRKGEEKE